MISLSGYYNETQKSADTVLSGWSMLAFGLPAVFRENTILQKQRQTSGFQNLSLPRFIGINLLQIGTSGFKLNAIEWLHSLTVLAFYNAFCHWSSCSPFWKLRENKNRWKLLCSKDIVPVWSTHLNSLLLTPYLLSLEWPWKYTFVIDIYAF